VHDEEAIALLREIRNLLIAQREGQKISDDKYQKYLDHSRQDYADEIKQSRWSRRKELILGLLVFSIMLTFGVFIGVLVGVRMSRPW
jgi:hypothetical protein